MDVQAEQDIAVALMNVSVPDAMRDWVQERVEAGQYASISDYVSDLIRRDQAQVDDHETINAALVEGEESGISSRRIPEILIAVKAEVARTAG